MGGSLLGVQEQSGCRVLHGEVVLGQLVVRVRPGEPGAGARWGPPPEPSKRRPGPPRVGRTAGPPFPRASPGQFRTRRLRGTTARMPAGLPRSWPRRGGRQQGDGGLRVVQGGQQRQRQRGRRPAGGERAENGPRGPGVAGAQQRHGQGITGLGQTRRPGLPQRGGRLVRPAEPGVGQALGQPDLGGAMRQGQGSGQGRGIGGSALLGGARQPGLGQCQAALGQVNAGDAQVQAAAVRARTGPPPRRAPMRRRIRGWPARASAATIQPSRPSPGSRLAAASMPARRRVGRSVGITVVRNRWMRRRWVMG